MTRRAVLAALAAALTLAAPAAADDGSLVGSLLKWSVRISADATAMVKAGVTPSTTPAQLEAISAKLETTARAAHRDIAGETASSGTGRKLRSLTLQAFTDFAIAGNELVAGVEAVKRKDKAGAAKHVNLALGKAREGSKLLTAAADLIPKLTK